MKRPGFAAFVEAHYRVVGRSGAEWSVLCPVHDDHNASMRINIDKAVGFCHGCGVRGGMTKLAQLVGVHLKAENVEDTVSLLIAKLDKLRRVHPEERQRFLPESALGRYNLPTTYWTDPPPHGRGLTQDTVEAFDLGYDPIDECAIIPVRDMHGRLLGVTRRFLSPDAAVRYRDPKRFHKSDHLFAAWLVAQHPSATVAITEGAADSMKVWQAGHPAVAQFGSYLSPNQIRVLRKLGIVTTILMHDNDKAGHRARLQAMGWTHDTESGWRYAAQTDLRRFFIVKHTSYRGLRANDPGKMSDQTIDRSISQAKVVM